VKRLVDTQDYQRAYTQGAHASTGLLKIYITDNALAYTRLGIVVGRRVSLKAVARNRIKRAIRHWFRRYLPPALCSRHDIIVVARPGNTRRLMSASLYADLEKIFKA
jgi:ribonuclease P protein component